MNLVIRIPRHAAANKPPHGKPCNLCGICCMATLCPLGEHIFGRKIGPCPALTPEGESTPQAYFCGLTVNPDIPEEMKEAAKLLIGAGQGCDARINGEPSDAEFNARLLRQDAIDADRAKKAKRIWGAMP